MRFTIFNNINDSINYSFSDQIWHVAVDGSKGCQGVATEFNGVMYAFYFEKDFFYFQVGNENILLDPSTTEILYNHLDGGETYFAIKQNGEVKFELKYSSWWMNDYSTVIPLDIEDDEDEDFFGFVHFIWSASDNVKQKHLQYWAGL